MILGLGPWELALLAILFSAIFGLKQLPKAARELGRLHAWSLRLKQKLPWVSRFF
ncbi:mttA/Hcf106 family protein [Desulfuromusa kysingii]|uniref:MttA/Hcf106 family protein n=1 Tax=Desulfuromusa kysingii TaxID=37625 RepID=A0A1H4C4P0_9BACT|nr:twin-arginine translocase TatA/TatE family subunit [Desulfuromusa kysingii]SEA55425.1 mttA/Hcf106 family protein [Desulfuromusa kysingii]